MNNQNKNNKRISVKLPIILSILLVAVVSAIWIVSRNKTQTDGNSASENTYFSTEAASENIKKTSETDGPAESPAREKTTDTPEKEKQLLFRRRKKLLMFRLKRT